jgi:hypothetical protein
MRRRGMWRGRILPPRHECRRAVTAAGHDRQANHRDGGAAEAAARGYETVIGKAVVQQHLADVLGSSYTLVRRGAVAMTASSASPWPS